MGSTGAKTTVPTLKIKMTEGGLYGVYAGDTFITSFRTMEDAVKGGARAYERYTRVKAKVYTYDDIEKGKEVSRKRSSSGRLILSESSKTVWKVGGKSFPTLKAAKAWVDSQKK